MPKKVMVIGAGFASVGSAILQMKPEILSAIPVLLAGIWPNVLSFSGIALTIIGLAIIVMGLIRMTRGKVAGIADSVKELLIKNWLYTHVCASIGDLPTLFKDFQTVFGTDIAPMDEMKKWWSRNDKIAWRIIRSTGDGDREYVGFFELIPITVPAAKKIEAGELDGRTLVANHIASRGNKAAAYYVGSIAAVKPLPLFKFATMFLFLEHLRQKSATSDVVLYARPVTPDGLRLLQDYKFKKLFPRMKDEESVWKAVLPQGSNFEELERTYRRILKGAAFAAA